MTQIARLGFCDIPPFGKAHSPPFVIFSEWVKLREIYGDKPFVSCHDYSVLDILNPKNVFQYYEHAKGLNDLDQINRTVHQPHKGCEKDIDDRFSREAFANLSKMKSRSIYHSKPFAWIFLKVGDRHQNNNVISRTTLRYLSHSKFTLNSSGCRPNANRDTKTRRNFRRPVTGKNKAWPFRHLPVQSNLLHTRHHFRVQDGIAANRKQPLNCL